MVGRPLIGYLLTERRTVILGARSKPTLIRELSGHIAVIG
jgi:hypothetical protein